MRGRQAARKQRELAETSVPLDCERAGLKGWWRLRMCQQAIRILRATADLAGFLPARWAMPAVELVPGVGRPPGGVGGFDSGPAQRARSRLRERAGAGPLAGLVHARRETGVADQLARRREPGDVADLARQGQPEQVTDAGDRLEQHDPLARLRPPGAARVRVARRARRANRSPPAPRRSSAATSRRRRVRRAAPSRPAARSRSSEIRSPHCVSRPKIRFIADARNRTRCIRRRSCSRSARSSSDGSQSAGTKSRRQSSASTRASTLSVLQASGATSRTLRACATCTSPAGRRQLIVDPDRAAHHLDARSDIDAELQNEPGEPVLVGQQRPPRRRSHRPRQAHTTPPVDTPNRSRHTASQGLPSRVELQTNAQSAGRPSFMTFHAKEPLLLKCRFAR